MKPYRIVVIDDDVHINAMLEEMLVREGYEVSKAFSGTEALLLLEKEKPDLILLDLMLPGMSGQELLQKIKNIPVIILSARADVTDKVDLLLGGAADYVTKPFVPDELLARIVVQLRKRGTENGTDRFAYDDLVLKTELLTVTVKGGTRRPTESDKGLGGSDDKIQEECPDTDVRLTRTECAILKLLMQNPRTPVGRTTILEKISMDTPDCTERSLKQHISNLRKKLQAVNGRDYIETIYGIGFRLR